MESDWLGSRRIGARPIRRTHTMADERPVDPSLSGWFTAALDITPAGTCVRSVVRTVEAGMAERELAARIVRRTPARVSG